MSMVLPNLDNVTWEQLNEEARALIPAYAPDWTNFNPSDPGITLLELLAYFTEMLLYRANRISDEHRLQFLRLLNAPGWKPEASLEEERRRTLISMTAPLRAVTAKDFEAVAIAALKTSEAAASARFSRIARAKCLTGRNLGAADARLHDAPAPGHVSVILVPHAGAQLSRAHMHTVERALDAAKLVTMCVHVVSPVYVSFGVRLTLATTRQASADDVRTEALERLVDFFDPLRGGHARHGWPFGRNVYVSELYRLLGRIDGVDYVTRSIDADGEDIDEIVVDAENEHRRQLNDENELESIEIREWELVRLTIAPQDIVVQAKGGRL
jgi:hypothetical protein